MAFHPSAAGEQHDQPEIPAARPSRRERRARRGGPAEAVQGPVQGRRHPVPVKPRDYAARRRG